MEQIVGLKKLRQNMNDYVRKVKRGQSFTVVKQATPIFRVVPLDMAGNESEWETVVDFTKIKKGGISTKELLKRLKKLDTKN